MRKMHDDSSGQTHTSPNTNYGGSAEKGLLEGQEVSLADLAHAKSIIIEKIKSRTYPGLEPDEPVAAQIDRLLDKYSKVRTIENELSVSRSERLGEPAGETCQDTPSLPADNRLGETAETGHC